MNNYKYKIPYPKFPRNNNISKNVKPTANTVSNRLSNRLSNIKSELPNVQINTTNAGKSFLYFLLLIVIVLIMVFILVTMYYILADCNNRKPFIQYLLDMDFKPCSDETNQGKMEDHPIIREILDEKEGYFIGPQVYTQEQARCKCKSYGGRLGTKNDIIKFYNKGGNSCEYGWTEDGAFFAVQPCKWKEIQKSKDAWTCGNKPGVVGGEFSPNVKFNAFCVGVKPKGELVQEKAPVCTNKDFCDLRKNYFAGHKMRDDRIMPFNKDKKKWSMYD